MQIFVTSPEPAACAQALDDRRVIKMAVEAAQILCTASSTGPYKPTHANHPCVRWAADRRNAFWLWRHLQALTDEYEHRFGRVHLTATKMEDFPVHPALPPSSQRQVEQHRPLDQSPAARMEDVMWTNPFRQKVELK